MNRGECVTRPIDPVAIRAGRGTRLFVDTIELVRDAVNAIRVVNETVP